RGLYSHVCLHKSNWEVALVTGFCGSSGIAATRSIPNGMIDRRPALIACCAGVADVRACVQFAGEHALLVSVRGGGHSVAGTAVCDGGLMIDLARMQGVS